MSSYDSAGNLLVNVAVGGGGGGGGGSVNIADPTTATQKLKVNADGSINVNPSSSSSSTAIQDGTTASHKLAVDATGKIGVNNFPATQPVSGNVTANAGTNLNTSVLALETGGNLAAAKLDLDAINSHTPALGQATKSASVPVTLASDQGNTPVNVAQFGGVAVGLDNTNELKISLYGKNSVAGDTPVAVDSAGRVIVAQQASTATLYTLASQSTGTSADSGSLDVTKYREALVLCNVTAATGTTPTIQFFVESLGSDGIWYAIYSSSTLNGVATVVKSVGSGQSSATSLGNTIRLRWAITGTTPSFTFSASIIVK